MKKLTTEIFIERSNKIHNNRYDYSLVNYKNYGVKVNIICPEHGIFLQMPNEHFIGCGCPYCAGTKKKNKYEFIKKSNKIHNNKYDYSLVDYKNNKTKVKIICIEHGIFIQKPDAHMQGAGCIRCGNNSKKIKLLDFIERSNEIHNNKYDYSLVEYKNSKIKVKIICPKHGIFEQTSRTHLIGRGCPICNESKGEKKISSILKQLNLNYNKQKIFDYCRDKNVLPFDFYLPSHNTCIEYDGKQHFESIDYFGGDENFAIIKKHDEIRNNFCEKNNIKLIRIRYDENDIEEKIKNMLC
jgi:very-short-patch-repair endonuclease